MIITIKKKVSKIIKHNINIFNENPNSKTYASYVLLKRHLADLEEPPYMEWLRIRHSFLEKQEELVCEFCGKPHLEIGEIEISKLPLNNMNQNQATIDHLLAKSKYPQFKFSEFNFIISCKKCNNKKGNLLLEEWVEQNPQIDWYSFFEKHQEILKYVPKLNKYQLKFV